MRYCLVTENPRLHPFSKVIFFYCKRDLIDWVSSHRFCINNYVSRRMDVHRVNVDRSVPIVLKGKVFKIGVRLCSLYEFSVKHKLL